LQADVPTLCVFEVSKLEFKDLVAFKTILSFCGDSYSDEIFSFSEGMYSESSLSLFSSFISNIKKLKFKSISYKNALIETDLKNA